MGTIMRKILMGADVSEIYSPDRVCRAARELGLRAGWSLDFTTVDSQGRPWDFRRADCRNRAARLVIESKPMLLVGSPMCTMFSIIQHLNMDKVDPDEWRRK